MNKIMPTKELFDKLQKKYSPFVRWLIDSNQAYMNVSERIRWGFTWNDELAITGGTDRKTNIISVNLAYVDEAYSNNALYDIEYFLIHEMRHVYQHLEIKKYNNKEKISVDSELIKDWIEEGKNYVASVNENREENIDYFRQKCELDAYAFSFALMHQKYRGRYDGLLYVPPIYKSELKEKYDSAVKEFVDFLK